MRLCSVSLCLCRLMAITMAASSFLSLSCCHGFTSPAGASSSNKMVRKAGTGIPTRVVACSAWSSRVAPPLKAVAVQDTDTDTGTGTGTDTGTDVPRVTKDDASSVLVESKQPQQSNEQQGSKQTLLRAGKIMKMLPKESFRVDTKTSLTYFGIDAVAVIASVSFLYAVVTSDTYTTAPLYLQAAMVAPLQIMTGFAMWCNWCIGHDAGHSLISKKHQWLNDVVGEVSHSVLALTPFVPWQLSHRRHHLNHNHLTKDYSHQWFIRGNGDSKEAPVPEVPADDMVWWMKLSYQTRNLQLPILYLVYLLVGVPDGGHVFLYGKLWEGVDLKTKLRAYGSVAVSVLTATSLWAAMGTANFAVVCFAPWLVMSCWLFAVTYLQHHSDDGKLYTDKTWKFAEAAFETVDRSYGKWTDRMSHHMMDGHVVHHLFFERVPHYRLEKATKALQEGLEKSNQGHLYKNIDTPNYVQEIVSQFDNNWFFVDEKQVVR